VGQAEIVPGETSVVFFEPGGLLLLASLRPSSADRFDHALVLQMTYLGPGEIDVDVLLVAAGGTLPGAVPEPHALSSSAALGRTGDTAPPLVWTREVALSPDTELLWIVRGQSGPDRPLRGELRSTVIGRPSLVAVETRAGVTRE
jgi:hypothetical protein